MRTLTSAVALVAAVAGCGAADPDLIVAGGTGGAAAARVAAAEEPLAPPGTPPTVHLRGGGRELHLRPWAFCWREGAGGRCGDGLPPQPAPDVGSPALVEMAFAATGWKFTATFERSGVACGRANTTPMVPTGPGTFALEPQGTAGDYAVTLSGRGHDAAGTGGDVAVSFRWHTPRHGPNEAPVARASILSGTPPEVRSLGVDLRVDDLRSAPASARASAVVTSSNGASSAIVLEPHVGPCAPPGTLTFTAPEAEGRAAAGLGPPPFSYEITLIIDGATYRGRAVWPDDEEVDLAPSTRLRFDPPLPGL